MSRFSIFLAAIVCIGNAFDKAINQCTHNLLWTTNYNTWTQSNHTLPRNSSIWAIAYMNGDIFLLGGTQYPNQMIKYNIHDDNLTDLGENKLLQPIQPQASSTSYYIQVDNILYYLSNDDSISSFNLETNNFITNITTFSIRQQSCLTSYNNLLYIIGGYNSTAVFGDGIIFNITSQQWTSSIIPSMQTPRRIHSCIINTNYEQIWVFGGTSNATSTKPQLSSVEKIDINAIQNNNWSYSQDLEIGVIYTNSLIHQNLIFIFGGSGNYAQGRNKIQIINCITGETSLSQQLIFGVFSSATLLMNNRIYLFGGIDGNGATNRWQYFDLPSQVYGVTVKISFNYESSSLLNESLSNKVQQQINNITSSIIQTSLKNVTGNCTFSVDVTSENIVNESIFNVTAIICLCDQLAESQFIQIWLNNVNNTKNQLIDKINNNTILTVTDDMVIYLNYFDQISPRETTTTSKSLFDMSTTDHVTKQYDDNVIYIILASIALFILLIIISIIIYICILKRKSNKDTEKINDHKIIKIVQNAPIDSISSQKEPGMLEMGNLASINHVELEGNQIESWLKEKCGLEQYVQLFYLNGYKSLENIKEIKQKERLKEIGIELIGHQSKIWKEIQILKNPKIKFVSTTTGTGRETEGDTNEIMKTTKIKTPGINKDEFIVNECDKETKS